MKRYLPLFLLLGALVLPAPAQAAACSGTSGVTVVVQFPDRTQIGCAAGDPATGFKALQAAGFSSSPVQQFPAALCQIDGYPTNPCPRMPPANAYWAYFHAKRGGSWSYSNEGPGTFDPAPGSVEGWRFGGGATAPSTSPPAASRPAPTSKPTHKPKPTAVATPVVEPVETSRTPTMHPSHLVQPTKTAPTATVSADPAPVRAVGTTEKPAPATASSSQGLSWIWGIGLLGVLVAAGGATVVRRRRS